MATPIIFPIPKVIPAATKPKRTWRKPDLVTDLPVMRVIAAPIKNNPTVLKAMLRISALLPVKKKKGNTGIIAPVINRKKDAIAASQAEPSNSS